MVAGPSLPTPLITRFTPTAYPLQGSGSPCRLHLPHLDPALPTSLPQGCIPRLSHPVPEVT